MSVMLPLQKTNKQKIKKPPLSQYLTEKFIGKMGNSSLKMEQLACYYAVLESTSHKLLLFNSNWNDN